MNEPCPNVVTRDGDTGVCGRPIHDTGYICGRCRRDLARRLLATAALWQTLEDATGHQLRIDHPPHTGRRAWHGPRCPSFGQYLTCDHESCVRAHRSYIQHLRDLDRPAREDRGPVAWDTSEAAWVAANTVTSWALFVTDQRGTPVPHLDAPVRHEPHLEPVPKAVREARAVWCVYGDLPAVECGCGNPNATHPKRSA